MLNVTLVWWQWRWRESLQVYGTVDEKWWEPFEVSRSKNYWYSAFLKVVQELCSNSLVAIEILVQEYMYNEEDSESSNNNAILEPLNRISFYFGASLGDDGILRKFVRDFLRYIQHPIYTQTWRLKLGIVKKIPFLAKTHWSNYARCIENCRRPFNGSICFLSEIFSKIVKFHLLMKFNLFSIS